MKTNELTGAALDWAVSKAIQPGWENWRTSEHVRQGFHPSTDWAQGGPILQREKIATAWHLTRWVAWRGVIEHPGPTPLIAAMRAYVASKLGDEVDVPGELCSTS